MMCPKCKGFDARCVDSRDRNEGRRRRYACPCGSKFTTIELPVEIAPGMPGMPRGSTAVDALKEGFLIDAERRAKDRLRELLDTQL